jgi:hypothetical protein
MVETKLNFFLIGAPKAGTTHVHARLSRHPHVYLSPLKEPNHFATDIDPARFSPAFRSNVPADLKGYLADRPLCPRQIGFVHDREQYRLLFDAVRPEHAVVGECSTSYLWSKEAASHVAEAYPEARILCVLRNPVERLHSHWLMARKYGFTTAGLLDAVKQDQAHPDPSWGRSELFVEAGLYAEGLRRWMDLFPKERVKVLLNEDLNRPETWTDLADWLGVEDAIPDVEAKAGNPAGLARWEGLNAWLTSTGLKAQIGRWMPRSIKNAVRDTWYTREGLEGLSEEDRAALMPHFEADIRNTGILIGRDLGHWLAQ